MSGFSAEWLRLREPADHRARDESLVARLAKYFRGRDTIRLVDLGCGTGSNLRALAPRLPMRQSWRLIDHDAQLLKAASEEINAWRRGVPALDLDLAFEAADLSADIERVLSEDCDIVTASALFDLVSESWLDRFAALLAQHRPVFYTVLIFDGVMRWHPAHPADERIGAAFCAHQHQDKGFGPAAGPDAGRYLMDRLGEAGYRVVTAASPWLLTSKDSALIAATAEGVAQAAEETGRVSRDEIADWRATRASIERCEIGHSDLLALPR